MFRTYRRAMRRYVIEPVNRYLSVKPVRMTVFWVVFFASIFHATHVWGIALEELKHGDTLTPSFSILVACLVIVTVRDGVHDLPRAIKSFISFVRWLQK